MVEIPNISKSFQKAESVVPTDYTGTTQRLMPQKDIKAVAGGEIKVLDKLIGPAEEGVPRRDSPLILTGKPLLPEASTSAFTSQTWALANQTVYLATGLQAALTSIAEGAKEDSSLDYVRAGIEEFEKEAPPGSEPGVETPQQPEVDLFTAISENLGASPTNFVSPESSKAYAALQSTDKAVVEQQLIALADLDHSTLSADDKQLLLEKLQMLAENVSTENETGGHILLGLSVPEAVTAALWGGIGLKDDTKITPEQREMLSNQLMAMGEKIASTNLDQLLKTQLPSQEYQDLTSNDPVKLTTLLASLVAGMELPEGTDKGMVTKALKDLAEALIAAGVTDENGDLRSADPSKIEAAIQSALEKLESSGQIPQNLAAILNNMIAPKLSQELADINKTKLTQDLSSSDQNTIEAALKELSGMNGPPEPPAVQQVLQDYLKAMATALAFMAQIRALIVKLEDQFTGDLAKAKLASIGDQIQKAAETYTKELEKIATDYSSNITNIQNNQLMQIFMPLIAVIVAIITVIVSAVSLVGAIFTGGAAGAAGVLVAMALAKVIVLCIALAASVATLVISVVDAGYTWATGTGFIDTMCESWGITDPTVKAVINLVINLIAIIIAAIVTCGVGFALIAGMLAKLGLTVAQTTIKEVLVQIVKTLAISVVVKSLVASAIGVIFSSGLITQAFIALLKACGCNDEDSAIGAMVLSIITMLVAMLMGHGISSQLSGGAAFGDAIKNVFKSIGSGFAQAGIAIKNGLVNIGKSIGEFFKKLVETLKRLFTGDFVKEMSEIAAKVTTFFKNLGANLVTFGKKIGQFFKDMKEYFKELTSSGLSTVKNAVTSDFSRVVAFLKTMLHALKEILTSPNGVVILEMMADLLKAVASFIQAGAASKQSDIKLEQARLERELGALTAITEFLQQLQGVDAGATIKALNEEAKKQQEAWHQLLELVAGFISDASSRVSQVARVVA